jgi:hypothetical protein
MKVSARILRWRILAETEHRDREVDLILSIENLRDLITLGWESRSPVNWRVLLACIAWVSRCCPIKLSQNISDT